MSFTRDDVSTMRLALERADHLLDDHERQTLERLADELDWHLDGEEMPFVEPTEEELERMAQYFRE